MADDGWHDATALTDTEDHAAGVATDGSVAVFSTGGSQVGENAVRAVPLDGSSPSRVLVTRAARRHPGPASWRSRAAPSTSRSVARSPPSP